MIFSVHLTSSRWNRHAWAYQRTSVVTSARRAFVWTTHLWSIYHLLKPHIYVKLDPPAEHSTITSCLIQVATRLIRYTSYPRARRRDLTQAGWPTTGTSRGACCSPIHVAALTDVFSSCMSYSNSIQIHLKLGHALQDQLSYTNAHMRTIPTSPAFHLDDRFYSGYRSSMTIQTERAYLR